VTKDRTGDKEKILEVRFCKLL